MDQVSPSGLSAASRHHVQCLSTFPGSKSTGMLHMLPLPRLLASWNISRLQCHPGLGPAKALLTWLLHPHHWCPLIQHSSSLLFSLSHPCWWLRPFRLEEKLIHASVLTEYLYHSVRCPRHRTVFLTVNNMHKKPSLHGAYIPTQVINFKMEALRI
jgi:hypothetical protein